jgi:hypothetical protein
VPFTDIPREEYYHENISREEAEVVVISIISVVVVFILLPFSAE